MQKISLPHSSDKIHQHANKRIYFILKFNCFSWKQPFMILFKIFASDAWNNFTLPPPPSGSEIKSPPRHLGPKNIHPSIFLTHQLRLSTTTSTKKSLPYYSFGSVSNNNLYCNLIFEFNLFFLHEWHKTWYPCLLLFVFLCILSTHFRNCIYILYHSPPPPNP